MSSLPIGVVAIFCEDIREEKSGQDTLIGILPDNLVLLQVPALLPKLAVYIRVHFHPSVALPPFKAKVVTPDGRELDAGHADADLIERARKEATGIEVPYAGVIIKVVFAAVALKSPGLLTVSLDLEGQDRVCGALRITLVKPLPNAPIGAGPSARPPSPPDTPI